MALHTNLPIYKAAYGLLDRMEARPRKDGLVVPAAQQQAENLARSARVACGMEPMSGFKPQPLGAEFDKVLHDNLSSLYIEDGKQQAEPGADERAVNFRSLGQWDGTGRFVSPDGVVRVSEFRSVHDAEDRAAFEDALRKVWTPGFHPTFCDGKYVYQRVQEMWQIWCAAQSGQRAGVADALREVETVCRSKIVKTGDDFALGAHHLAIRILAMLAAAPTQQQEGGDVA